MLLCCLSYSVAELNILLPNQEVQATHILLYVYDVSKYATFPSRRKSLFVFLAHTSCKVPYHALHRRSSGPKRGTLGFYADLRRCS